MIGWLRGRVLRDEVEGSVLLDVGGVGYELSTPAGTVSRSRAGSAAAEVEVFVHTNVREDALELFGFSSELERRCFRQLLTVPKVGPRLALNLLSALPPADLGRAVAAADVQRLSKVPGIGRRTAERIVTELRDKLPTQGPGPNEGRSTPSGSAEKSERLLAALTNMGYKPAEARRAVEALAERIERDSLADLIRAALAQLAS